MAHFRRFRSSGARPDRKRSGWQLAALGTRLAIVVLVVVVCLRQWGTAQERAPKTTPAVTPPAATRAIAKTGAAPTPPPPAEANDPVPTRDAGSQPSSAQPAAGPATA